MFREEYPRPSFVRSHWRSLNGKWNLAICNDDASMLSKALPLEIEVPFCLESKLGGVEHRDFVTGLWYRREVVIAEEEMDGSVIINFGAVDYECELFVNGISVGSHKGGYTSFAFDITAVVHAGKNTLDLRVRDDTRSLAIPSGKQSHKAESYGCMYTRTTGIWQSVWLEFTSPIYVVGRKITPDVKSGSVKIELELNKSAKGVAKTLAYLGEKEEGYIQTDFVGNRVEMNLKVRDAALWDTKNPTLYDLKLEIEANGKCDSVQTYFAFRTVEFQNGLFMLNGKHVFLRMILDQGFYPDGIYTAPTKEDIEGDIDIAMSFGFNGARPHEKVFEDWYLYYADKKGYLVWSEYPNWGCDFSMHNPECVSNFIGEWQEVIKRDYNHPAVIGYCPLNEAWCVKGRSSSDSATQKMLYDITKAYDPQRPFIGSSGGYHFVTDVDDFHNYTHDAVALGKSIAEHINGPRGLHFAKRIFYELFKGLLRKKDIKGLPIFLSEYGGIGYLKSEGGWGYNKALDDEAKFVKLYCDLTRVILSSDSTGFCYTQLTDVEQEQNGLVKYDRTPKLSTKAMEAIRLCNTTKSKYEKGDK